MLDSTDPSSQMALDVFKEDPEFRKHEEEYQVRLRVVFFLTQL